MPLDRSDRQDAPVRGVAIKLFGVMLIFLGVLDSMLFWRGGFAAGEKYLVLILFGLLLYAIGAIRCGNRR